MEKSTHKPTYKELERSLRKAEKRAQKAEGSLKESNKEKAVLKRKIKKLELSKNVQNSKKKACLTTEQTESILKKLNDILTHPTQYLQD